VTTGGKKDWDGKKLGRGEAQGQEKESGQTKKYVLKVKRERWVTERVKNGFAGEG